MIILKRLLEGQRELNRGTDPPGTGTGNQYTDGVTNNGAAQGNVDFVVPQDAPDLIYYQCQYHSQ